MKLGLLDDPGKALGDASKALDALGGAPAGAVPSKPAKFTRDETLAVPVGKDSITVAKKTASDSTKPTAANGGPPTEFIHYGLVHADIGIKFPHGNFSPIGAQEAPTGHAIMFRDGLEREAILLHGFISSCKVILKEYLKDKGPLGDVGAVVGSLLGGGPSEPKPDPTQLDSFISQVKAAADKIKPATINYKEIHDAGKALHQARTDFNNFTVSLNKYYLKPPKDSGPAGLLGNIPGVGNIIQVVQRFLFKMFDIYLAVYLELRGQDEKDENAVPKLERAIEMASHKMTIKAITSNYEEFALTYPIWFPKDKTSSNGSGGTPGFLKPVTDAVDDVKKEVDSVENDIYGFAGANEEPPSTPGSDQLKAVFNILKGEREAGKDSSPPSADDPPSAADATISALNKMLSDVGGLPSFLNGPIKEITKANVSLLEDVYKRLMAQKAGSKIESSLLLEAGRHYLTGTISGMFTKLVMGLITGGKADDASVGIPGKEKVLSGKQLIGHQLDEKLGKYVEPILQIAIGDLAGNLEASRSKAGTESMTMEVFLGRLPWLVALMFRNTFFPIWNIVAENVFGSIGGPLASALKSANSVVNKAKDAVDTTDEARRRAKKLNETKDEGVNVGLGGSNLDKYKNAAEDETDEGKARDEERRKQQEKSDQMDQFFQDNDKDKDFPMTGRIAEGTGVEVKEKIPSVLPEPA